MLPWWDAFIEKVFPFDHDHPENDTLVKCDGVGFIFF